MWSCDDLVPDLCDLNMTKGYLTVRGINVTYWKYSKVDDDKNKETDPTNEKQQQQQQLLLPIVVIHGGPAFLHNYMLPLKQQACRGRDVYFYDQAGCGESSVPSNNNNNSSSIQHDFPWLFTISYYANEELPALISHLGLKRFHIIANSWGTVLSQFYALNNSHHDDDDDDDDSHAHLASMVLSGPFSDADLYIKSQWDQNGNNGSIGNLPLFVQGRIRILEEQEAYDTPEYQQINDILTLKFTCRTAPLPDCVQYCEDHYNHEIYVGMQGASEFTIGGVLGDLNITHRLSELTNLPVLLTHGQYDTMRPAVVQAMYDALPIAEKVLLTKSGHMSMIDEPGEMNNAIANFLDRVEFVPHGIGDPSIIVTAINDDTAGNTESINHASYFISIVALLLVGFLSGILVGKRFSSSRGQYSTVPP